MRHPHRLIVAALAALAATGCTDDAGAQLRGGSLATAAATPASASASADTAAQAMLPPHVLLVAVGDEQPVFDRFVGDLARRFATLDVASLATASASGGVGLRFDRPAELYAAIRGMRTGPARKGAGEGGCLVYLTGHGARTGMAMPLAAASTPAQSPARRYAALRPRELAAALREGCGDAPTVVVTSACYSGVYLGRRGAGMRGAGRIVLTAAAPDRTSFGCADDETYTYYDGCFLRSLDAVFADTAAAPTWHTLAGRTAACVAERERALLPGSPPSNP